MNIKVEILDSETTVLENGVTVKRAKSGKIKKADGVLVHIYENTMGKLYGIVVMSTGEIERISYDLIKVVDKQYV